MEIKKIAILCSGGDAPGMNSAIRAVVRSSLYHNITPIGIYRGYQGLIESDFIELNASSVGNTIQRGGTILQSSRCPDFFKEEIREKAARNLKKYKIDALVVIGGDGSFNGAHLLNTEHQIPVIGIPGTIDNDIAGTEYTIGFDTAVQTAVEAVDKIRDTASSHDRTFIVEVMGRKSPTIALAVGVSTGAEWVVTPQDEHDTKSIAQSIRKGMDRGKKSSIIIVAEGQTPGLSYNIQEELSKKHQIDSKVCVLGHIQRGGSPSAMDRFRASQMGALAIDLLRQNKMNQVCG